MIDFLKTWGALIVAFVALVQPWVKSAWQNFLRKPILIPHPAGTIEIGFSSFGPTIGLMGTLEGHRRETFVRSMGVVLTRMKDGASHHFTWGVFRSFAFGTTEQRFELSSGFLLRPEEPHRYNIQFWDRAFQKELQPQLEALRQAWQDRLLERLGDTFRSVASGSGLPQPEIQSRVEEIYQEFAREEIHVSTYATIQRMCYWEPGTYRLDLRVSTSRPGAVHAASWNFDLGNRQAASLRLNIVKVLKDVSGQPDGQFNFIYHPYEDDDLGTNA